MSTGAADLRATPGGASLHVGTVAGARAYFASDSRRTIQTVLGLIWLLDGGLQFQSFVYGNGFVQMIKAMAPGPGLLDLQQP
jgi:hypothetical protein